MAAPVFSCATCFYWQPAPTFEGLQVRTAQCRFMPPVSIMTHDGTLISRWPITLPNQWCGQHATKERVAEAIEAQQMEPA